MNWLRSKLRAWLGINALELSHRNTASDVKSVYVEINDLDRRIQAVEKIPTLADVSRKQFEIDTAIQELKELKQAIADPKHRPVVTRTMREYRALMETE